MALTDNIDNYADYDNGIEDGEILGLLPADEKKKQRTRSLKNFLEARANELSLSNVENGYKLPSPEQKSMSFRDVVDMIDGILNKAQQEAEDKKLERRFQAENAKKDDKNINDLDDGNIIIMKRNDELEQLESPRFILLPSEKNRENEKEFRTYNNVLTPDDELEPTELDQSVEVQLLPEESENPLDDGKNDVVYIVEQPVSIDLEDDENINGWPNDENIPSAIDIIPASLNKINDKRDHRQVQEEEDPDELLERGRNWIPIDVVLANDYVENNVQPEIAELFLQRTPRLVPINEAVSDIIEEEENHRRQQQLQGEEEVKRTKNWAPIDAFAESDDPDNDVRPEIFVLPSIEDSGLIEAAKEPTYDIVISTDDNDGSPMDNDEREVDPVEMFIYKVEENGENEVQQNPTDNLVLIIKNDDENKYTNDWRLFDDNDEQMSYDWRLAKEQDQQQHKIKEDKGTNRVADKSKNNQTNVGRMNNQKMMVPDDKKFAEKNDTISIDNEGLTEEENIEFINAASPDPGNDPLLALLPILSMENIARKNRTKNSTEISFNRKRSIRFGHQLLQQQEPPNFQTVEPIAAHDLTTARTAILTCSLLGAVLFIFFVFAFVSRQRRRRRRRSFEPFQPNWFEQNLLESGSLTPINYVKCRHVPRLDTDDDAGPAADFDDKIRRGTLQKQSKIREITRHSIEVGNPQNDLSDLFTVPKVKRQSQTSSMFNSLDQCKIDRQLYQHLDEAEEDSLFNDGESGDKTVNGSNTHYCGSLKLAIGYDQNLCLLSVSLLQAIELVTKRDDGPPNPYFKICLESAGLPKIEHRSKTCKQTSAPFIQEQFFFPVTTGAINKTRLEIFVYDYDQFSVDECIGFCWLTLGRLALVPPSPPPPSTSTSTAGEMEVIQEQQSHSQPQKLPPTFFWAELLQLDDDNGKGHGEILFSISYLPKAQRLTLNVFKARNLCDLEQENSDLLSSIAVRVSLLSANPAGDGEKHRLKRKKTSSKKNTRNPQFNESFVFSLTRNALIDSWLEFEVVHEYGTLGMASRVIGRLMLPLNSCRDLWRSIIHGEKCQARWYSLDTPSAN